MAAPAAIFILLPGLAMAEVCDKGSLNLAEHLPILDQFLASTGDGAQLRKFFTPEALVTGAILIWLLTSSGTRATMTAIAWFVCLAIYHAVTYLSIDLADPYFQAAIKEGCVENSPRQILSNLGFAVIAALLTWQRIRRRRSA
ncbi:MAG: hypothetical protein KL863_16475 [Rhizobium sp.]|nr:hypothetical protein [Rhizobium sp.]